MAGLCGWLAAPGAQPATDHLSAMTRRLPGHHHTASVNVNGNAAASVLAAGSGGVFADGEITVAIDGSPRWRSPNAAEGDDMAAGVARVYREEGDGVVQRLAGPFALAIVDQRDKSALLAVDKMGMRPLAYVVTDGSLYFASSATALLVVPGVSNELDPQSLYNYVYFHVVPSPRTAFRDIQKAKPGHTLHFCAGRIRETPYWQPNYAGRSGRPKTPLLDVLRSGVAHCLAPTGNGSFLSGGLDSSTMAGLLNEKTGPRAPAFTIGFAQEGYDEIEYARTASRHFDLDLNDYYITADDVASAFAEVAAAYDEPFGNSSAVPTLICARLAASRGVTNLLAGDGGDELFAGNERYATQKLFGVYSHVPRWLRTRVLEPFFGRASVRRRDHGLQHKARRYIEQANVAMPARTQTYNLLQTNPIDSIFSPEFLTGVNAAEPLRSLAEAYDANADATALDRMLQMDWKFTLADNDLRKVGRMCDLAGVTVRYPLLEDEVVDHSVAVPSSMKLRGMRLRSYFKNQTRDFLPTEIIQKTKHGFGLPFGEWLRRDAQLKDLVRSRVAALRARRLFTDDYIDTLLRGHESEHAAYFGNFVWVLAMLEEWFQQHGLNP